MGAGISQSMSTRSRRPPALAALAGTLAVTLAACSGGTTDRAGTPGRRADRPATTGPAPPPGTPTTAGPEVAAPVPAVLDFAAPALGGGSVRGADYARTGLALWFWAPW